jgi:small-conductance mechanosensitive channel
MRAFSLTVTDALNPATLLGALLYGLVCAVAALLLARAIHFAVRRGSRFLSDPTAGSFLAQFLQVVVVLGAFILYAHLVPALRSLGTALLTGASVGAVVLGLAAQSTLGNLIAGFSILLYHPFRLGDQVEINTPKGVMRGTIDSLSLGYTTVSTLAGEHIIVPNSVMASAVMIRIDPSQNAAQQGSESASDRRADQAFRAASSDAIRERETGQQSVTAR